MENTWKMQEGILATWQTVSPVSVRALVGWLGILDGCRSVMDFFFCDLAAFQTFFVH